MLRRTLRSRECTFGNKGGKMALQVWLPLTKDLRQQGLSNATVTSNTATYSSTGGKLGGYYAKSLTVSSSNIATILSGYEFSVCFWIYINELPTETTLADTYVMYAGTAATRQQFHIAIRAESQGSAFAFCFYGDDYSFYDTVSDKLNRWMHVACLFKNNTQIVYVNGEKIGEREVTDKMSIPANSSLVVQNPHNRLNDLRIYDNCLTPEEVKKIAQGLVLHYPLSDPHIEGTTNLVTTESGISDTCYNGAVSKYGYGTETDMYKTFGTFEGRKCVKVYMGTTGLDAYPYVYFDNFSAAGTTIHTLSFDYFPTLQDTIIAYSYNGAYNFSYTTDKASNSIDNTGQIIIPVEVGRWNHITITAQKTDTTNTSRGIGYVRIGSARHTSNTSNYWLFSNIQVEAKDHATAYVGPNSTRIPTTVYDTSGFNNNGTISGTLTISTDTPKYQVSTYIPAATTISHTRCLDNTNQEWSCMAWVKPTVAGNYQNLNNFNSGNRLYHGTYPLLYLNSGTNDYYNYGNMALPINQWSHIAFVFKNSTGTKLIYINGENHTNTSGPNLTSTPLGIPETVIIGGANYEGGLCDYREYATALSAEEILDIYNNTAPVHTSLPTSPNLWAAANQGIINKTFTGGLTSFTQSNCQVTLTDDGYKIYRPPNVTYDANNSSTRTMWGGFVHRSDSPYLLKGHTYMIKIDIKGQTSNPMSDCSWTPSCGAGLPNSLSRDYSWLERGDIPENWSSTDYVTRTWRFTVNGNTVKQCTDSYGSFYAGNYYNVFRDFKIGFTYQSTGTLGTDLYIKNIRLYDITYETDLSKFA